MAQIKQIQTYIFLRTWDKVKGILGNWNDLRLKNVRIIIHPNDEEHHFVPLFYNGVNMN